MASNPQDVAGEAVADYRNRTKTPGVAVALHSGSARCFISLTRRSKPRPRRD
jgi:hypothetical protein